MTTDNLAVVLVGAVFGDFMAGGGTESRKKMQQARKCSEAEMHAKKEDMSVQVAAVKLLIVNVSLKTPFLRGKLKFLGQPNRASQVSLCLFEPSPLPTKRHSQHICYAKHSLRLGLRSPASDPLAVRIHSVQHGQSITELPAKIADTSRLRSDACEEREATGDADGEEILVVPADRLVTGTS